MVLLLLDRQGIGLEVDGLGEVIRASRSRHVPVALTRDQVRSVPAQLTGDKWIMTPRMYGAGCG